MVSVAVQTELTWPQGTDTPVPVKTNSQMTQTHSNQESAKHTGIGGQGDPRRGTLVFFYLFNYMANIF